jgi:hypothetical protein
MAYVGFGHCIPEILGRLLLLFMVVGRRRHGMHQVESAVDVIRNVFERGLVEQINPNDFYFRPKRFGGIKTLHIPYTANYFMAPIDQDGQKPFSNVS